MHKSPSDCSSDADKQQLGHEHSPSRCLLREPASVVCGHARLLTRQGLGWGIRGHAQAARTNKVRHGRGDLSGVNIPYQQGGEWGGSERSCTNSPSSNSKVGLELGNRRSSGSGPYLLVACSQGQPIDEVRGHCNLACHLIFGGEGPCVGRSDRVNVPLRQPTPTQAPTAPPASKDSTCEHCTSLGLRQCTPATTNTNCFL